MADDYNTKHVHALMNGPNIGVIRIVARDSIEQVNSEVGKCVRCKLHEKRVHAVPGDGNVASPILFIGEAPGQEEDLQGRPFVGAAGKLLTHLLSSINLGREGVYITNIVKCRPPENRPPRVDEVSACSKYLERQIHLINPRIVSPMGNIAVKSFLGKNTSISKVHGQPFPFKDNRILFPLYHPAAALYTAKLRSVLEADFKKLLKENQW